MANSMTLGQNVEETEHIVVCPYMLYQLRRSWRDTIQADVVSLHLMSLDGFLFSEFLQLLLHPYKL